MLDIYQYIFHYHFFISPKYILISQAIDCSVFLPLSSKSDPQIHLNTYYRRKDGIRVDVHHIPFLFQGKVSPYPFQVLIGPFNKPSNFILIKLSSMSQVANFSFATEVNLRQSSHPHEPPRRAEPASAYQKLRVMREKVRVASQSLHDQVTTHHRARRSLEEVTRKSLIKRIEFLKVYGNKKSKYQHRELLETKRREDEHVERHSVDLVRRRKLENQLHHILVQNEEEDHVYRLQSRNREHKEVLRRQLEMASERERNAQKHDLVRKGNTEFLIRKKNIQTSVSMRSKHNYYSKISQELTIIKQYEDIMAEIDNFATLQLATNPNDFTKPNDSTLDPFRTLDHPQPFLTAVGKPPTAS